jgi:hypothetical protein
MSETAGRRPKRGSQRPGPGRPCRWHGPRDLRLAGGVQTATTAAIATQNGVAPADPRPSTRIGIGNCSAKAAPGAPSRTESTDQPDTSRRSPVRDGWPPGECPTEQLPKNPIYSSPYPCQRALPKDFPRPGDASPGRFEEGWKPRTLVVNSRKIDHKLNPARHPLGDGTDRHGAQLH